MTKQAISVDIGGTAIKMARIDAHGKILDKWRIDTNTSDSGVHIPEEIGDAIATHLEDVDTESLAGIGVGVPAPISTDGFTVVRAVNLGWHELPLRSKLEQRFKLPVTLLNDANAAALGEMWQGAGRGTRSMMFVTLGTGVGAGIILDGKIINGAHSSCGEVGHIPVRSDEHRVCGCGNINCLETFTSANGMVKTMQRILKDAGVADRGEFTTIDIFQWLADGDPLAKQCVDETVDYLGSAMAGVFNTIDVERLVIGGGLSEAGDALMVPLTAAIDEHVFPQIREHYTVSRSGLGNDAGIFGDAATFLMK
ncbi:ROK family protein [Lacticaseibacillus sp. GG6-2]